MENRPSNLNLPLGAGLFTVFLCTIFGFNAVVIKFTFSGLGVFTTASLRFAITSAALFLWSRIKGESLRIEKYQLRPILILSAFFTIQLTLFYIGLDKSNASRGTLIINLLPFMVLFLAHLFIPGDRITLRRFLGIALGFVGVVFVFLEKKGISTAGGLNRGDLTILGATLLWSCSSIYLKRVLEYVTPIQIVFYSTLFSVPFIFTEALLWDEVMVRHFDRLILGALLFQSLITAAFGFVAWNTLLRKYGAVSLHSFLFITPIAGVLSGGLILGEPITLKIFLAMIFIVAGIITVHWHPPKEISVYPIRKSL